MELKTIIDLLLLVTYLFFVVNLYDYCIFILILSSTTIH